MPVTLITLLFFSATILFLISQLTIDQKFIQERKVLIREQELKKLSVSEIIDNIQNQIGKSEWFGECEYSEGVINYTVKETHEDVYAVTATITIGAEHRATFQFTYNKMSNTITRWVE